MRWLRMRSGLFSPRLELVADHRHFRDQVFALDEAVDQAVGFERMPNSRFSSVAGMVSK